MTEKPLSEHPGPHAAGHDHARATPNQVAGRGLSERNEMTESDARALDADGTIMEDGFTPYTPGVNCLHCGRFVGRDGALYYEYFEVSSTLASLDGECAHCIAEGVARV